jgi:hypothetical protein
VVAVAELLAPVLVVLAAAVRVVAMGNLVLLALRTLVEVVEVLRIMALLVVQVVLA